MTLELINPEGLSSPLSYTHVVAATESRLVFVAGQVADDADGNLVGDDDLAAQAHQAFANVGRALAAVGARPDHVAKLTIYVVGHRVEYLRVISEARGRDLRPPQAGRRDRRRRDAGRAQLPHRSRSAGRRRLMPDRKGHPRPMAASPRHARTTVGPQHSSYIHEHSRTTHSPTIDSLREIDAKTVWDRNDAVQVAEAILVDELSMDGTDRLV